MKSDSITRQLTVVLQYSSSITVIEGLKIFNSKYNNFFSNFKMVYVEDVESEKVSVDSFKKILADSNLVLIDVRSNRLTDKTLREVLSNRPDINVVVLMGAGMEIQGLTRLGDFHLGSIMNKFAGKKSLESNINDQYEKDIETFHEQEEDTSFKLKIVYSLRKIMKVFGTLVPVGSFNKIKQIFQLNRWWESGTVDNFVCILEYIAENHMGLKIEKEQKQVPQKYQECGFWNPKRGSMTISLDKYLKKYPLKKGKPTLLVIMYGGFHFVTSSATVRKIYEIYEKDWNIISFYTDGIFTTKYLLKYINLEHPPFDAVLSILWFPFNGGPGGGDLKITHKLLEKWNKPVFLGIGLYNQLFEDFIDRTEGLTPIQMLASVTFPEMDGLIDSIPVLSNKKEKYLYNNEEIDLIQPYTIEENLSLIMKRIHARIELNKIPNSEKKIGIILLNYPPGESNIGNAAYFDGLGSTLALIKEMKNQGYTISEPESCNISDTSSFKEWLLKNGLMNTPKFGSFDKIQKRNLKIIKISTEKINEWLNNRLSHSLKTKIEQSWGLPPGSIHRIENDVYLPIVQLGNIYIGIQPSRGNFEEIDKMYHDSSLPPHYQYLGFYYYLSEELHLHAIIHMGTHGTLEFLPGKEVGLTKEFCYNFSMIDEIPNFYLYQISNTSEAMIAKRRSLATLISYQNPPVIDNGLNQTLTLLEEKINLLDEAKKMNNPSISELEQDIFKIAKEKGITSNSINELTHEVIKIKTSLIPKGLHILGEGYSLQDTIRYIWLIQPMIRHRPNLYELLGKYYRLENSAIENLDGWILEDLKDTTRQKIKYDGLAIIEEIINGKSIQDLAKKFIYYPFIQDNSSNFMQLYNLIKEIAGNIMHNKEFEHLFRGLNGCFVPINLGGDPIRQPDILPSGYNLYQFNPQLIPTDLAIKRGVKIAEQSIELFRKENNGKYPKNIVIVLWGFETAKTHGESIGEIFHYLGIRLKQLSSWKREPELIPIKDLGRPRINVTIQICGFMRDLFSHVLEILDDAFDLAINTEETEDENYVKSHYLHLKRVLLKEGISEKEADFNARIRVFGPNASEYGSNLPNIIDSSSWKKEEDLGATWINQMSYVYRRNIRAKQNKELFTENLKNADMINQVRDSISYAITDLDHYYEFIGGLNQAAKISGNLTSPKIYINDTSTVKVETTTIKTAINRGVITRTANPVWVKEMLKHDYTGGAKVADRINYLLGFAATTSQVESEAWSQIHNTYVENQEIRDLMKKNNIFAFHKSIESMLEAIKRGLWKATPEQERKLKELYLELEGIIES